MSCGLGGHAAIDVQKPGRVLQHADRPGIEPEGRESSHHLPGGQVLDGQRVLGRRAPHSRDQFALLRTNRQTGAGGEQMNALALFQVVPPLVGPPDKGHVGRVLVVSLADDPRVAVRRALATLMGSVRGTRINCCARNGVLERHSDKGQYRVDLGVG